MLFCNISHYLLFFLGGHGLFKQIANYFNQKGVSYFLFRRNLLRRLVSLLANANRDAN